MIECNHMNNVAAMLIMSRAYPGNVTHRFINNTLLSRVGLNNQCQDCSNKFTNGQDRS